MKENNLNRSTSNSSEKTLKRRKKRKIRKLPFVILALILIILVSVVYAVSSYKNGLEVAKDKHQAPKIHKFNGASKNDGKATVLILVLTVKMVGYHVLTRLWSHNMTILRKI